MENLDVLNIPILSLDLNLANGLLDQKSVSTTQENSSVDKTQKAAKEILADLEDQLPEVLQNQTEVQPQSYHNGLIATPFSLNTFPDQSRVLSESDSHQAWRLSKAICTGARIEKPTPFNKLEKYEFKVVPSLEVANNKLNVFEKFSWKLLHALIFLQNNLEIFASATSQYPSVEEIPMLLNEYAQILEQLRSLNFFNKADEINNIISLYGLIANHELPLDLPSTEVQVLVKLNQYESEQAYADYKENQLKLSKDYRFKQGTMESVWKRIRVILKDIQKMFDQLKNKEKYFENKSNEKRAQAQQRNEQINNFSDRTDFNQSQEEIFNRLATHIDVFFSSSALDESNNFSNVKKYSDSPRNFKANPTPLLPEIENAVDFSKELNWWLCEVKKWLETLRILKEPKLLEASHQEKQEKEQKRFAAFSTLIQSHFSILEINYNCSTSQLKGTNLISSRPLGKEAIHLMLQNGKSAVEIIQIDQARAENLKDANFNLAIIEKQWEEFTQCTQQFTNAAASFSAQLNPLNSHSRRYSWNPLHWYSYYKSPN